MCAFSFQSNKVGKILPMLLSLSLWFQATAETIPEEAIHNELELVGDEHHGHHQHHFGLFLGSATRFHKKGGNETGFSYGIEYENRIANRWGVGVLGETIAFSKDHRDLAFAFPVSYYPLDRFKVSAGPGFETDGDERAFLFRCSVAYNFEIGKLTLTPEIAMDFTHGTETLVYGISFGRSF